MPKTRSYLIDKGFPPGRIFTRQFLASSEFHDRLLRALAKGPSGREKIAIAEQLARSYHEGRLPPDRLWETFLRKSRTWLSLKLRQSGTAVVPSDLNDPRILLSELGEEGWYGPLYSLGERRPFLLRTKIVNLYDHVDGSSPKLCKLRWTVVAELDDEFLAISWSNFTRSRSKESAILYQFPFWEHIPGIFDELEELVGGTWKSPNLEKVIFEDLWNDYMDDPGSVWKHLAVRTDLSGVALNARATPKVQVQGLQKLTRDLATKGVPSLGLEPTPSNLETLEDSLLCTILKDWGTRSYEFELLPTGDAADLKIRGNFFFGRAGPAATAQDSLQHIRCFAGWGGHEQLQDFILGYL